MRERIDLGETHLLHLGDGPLLVSVPHAGTEVAPDLRLRLTTAAGSLPDTDWWVDRVWEVACLAGASLLVARNSRYVIDLNRPPDDAPLYPGAGTGLVPVETFAGDPIYAPGDEPDDCEVADRLDCYWRPYHDALARELDRLRALHGFAILLDAHSIRSEVPRLFEGRLPDLNLGSNGGLSAAPSLVEQAGRQLEHWGGCTHVVDGRFRGGYITRHYGDPAHSIHALQMEMAQAVYMQESPPRDLPGRLDATRRQAAAFVQCLLAWRPHHG